ncbi:MAG: 16S rRNA (guanine(527)-N(7))-methyltransferase RsmG [Rhodobacterales bacterium CG2_30_65_12]|nr:MAG: 16S rRNA (guanine(527)-N(7))-methyltransferase RsmG [Rhodobacterales bacterium CG2_30_65_12]
MNGREAFLAEFNVSRETQERLDIYSALIEKWNPSINLVAKSTLRDHWTRHFLDSAQIFILADPLPGIWADLGTGGGFPGLIVAILAAEQRPDIDVICVESDTRKATFLRTVLRETGLSAKVASERAEIMPPLGAKTVSARALAPLAKLLGYAERHLAPDGRAIFLKGAGYEAEIAESLETFAFRLDTYPSKTDPGATILKLGDIQRV